MYNWFIDHQLKAMRRSSIWQKNLAINIILGFFMILMLLYLVAFGMFLGEVIREVAPGKNPVAIVNGAIIYYLGISFILGILMQKLPTLSIEPYLHLPIKRNALVHFLLGKSMLNLINFLPLAVFIPFGITEVIKIYSLGGVLLWLFTICFAMYFTDLLVIYFKRQLSSKPWVTGLFVLVLIGFWLLDREEVFSLSEFSSYLFGLSLKNILPGLIFIVLGFLSYMLNFSFLKSKIYPEELSPRSKKEITSSISWNKLSFLGDAGQLILLEVKLILRHKRTKSLLYLIPLYLLYGFFFYPQEVYRDGFTFIYFVGVFITGGLMIGYGNYFFSWEGGHFDAILSLNMNIKEYIRGKYLLIVSACTFSYVVTIPYLFYGTHILLINTAAFLFNIGFNAFLLLYFSTNNSKKMDMNKGAAFNWQGIGASNFILVLPILFLPMLIQLPFSLMDKPYLGIAIVALIGITGIVFSKNLLSIINQRFKQRKYKMAEGFREND
jgi:hypothetical protein